MYLIADSTFQKAILSFMIKKSVYTFWKAQMLLKAPISGRKKVYFVLGRYGRINKLWASVFARH